MTRRAPLALAFATLAALAAARCARPAPVRAVAARVRAPAGFEVHGHRGARDLRPENTLPAFERALEAGADTLETDLHLSRDGVVVMWHDPFVARGLCRVAPGAALSPPPPDPDALPANDPALRVRALDAAQLRAYRCDRNPDPAAHPRQRPAPGAVSGDAYGIAPLSALFDFVAAYAADPRVPPALRARAARVRFNLETKREPAHPEYIDDGFDGVAPGALERALVALLRARGLLARATVQSFDPRSLWAVRQLEPALRLSVLTEDTPADLGALAARGARVWSPAAREVTAGRVRAAHAAGLRVLPWTVNDAATARALIALGVDGLITDAPDVIADLVGPR